ncbi:MAG: serine hydrolase [Nocardioidaceae bacterium]
MTSPEPGPRALNKFVDTLPAEGSFSIWAGPVVGKAVFTHDAEAPHYAASTMKLALVLAAYRQADAGSLDLNAQVVVHDDFASAIGDAHFAMDRAEDSDAEPWRRIGSAVSIRWLAYRSIVRSSNLATNLVLDAVGLEPVAEALAAVGATGSVVDRGIEDAPARDAGRQNIVTARDLAVTLQALASGRAASADSCGEILDVLAAQQINDAIPAGLPVGTRVAHKSGWVEGISHDAGIVYPPDTAPYIFVMCTSSELDEQAGLDLIAAAAAASGQDRRVLT